MSEVNEMNVIARIHNDFRLNLGYHIRVTVWKH